MHRGHVHLSSVMRDQLITVVTARTEASIVGPLLIVIATAFPDITSMRQMQGPCLPLPILKLKKNILKIFQEVIFLSWWDGYGPT